MYKVFFNDSLILFGTEMKKSLNLEVAEKYDCLNYDIVSQIISKIESPNFAGLFLFSGNDIAQMWRDFKTYFVEIPAAGGLVKHSDGRLLFIKRLGVWDLPKGKIETDELPENAAVREVEEECGISELGVIRQLDSTYHIYRSPFLPPKKNLVLKETKWFLMQYAGTEIPVPEVEEDIEEVSWISGENIDAILKNTYSSLIDFLEKSLPII